MENWYLEVEGDEEFLMLRGPTCTLGYGEMCDLRLQKDSVSTQHAKFTRCKDGHWWVEDLASTNGTWVEDIEVKMPLALSPDMQLMFGDASVRVRLKKEKA